MAVKTYAQILAEINTLLATNSSNDISATDVRTCLIDMLDSLQFAPYKKYVALLTQTGTNAPVATELENTLSGTPVWSRNSIGQYYLTLASEWTANKVVVTLGNPTFNSGTGTSYYCFRQDANILVFDVPDGDDWLNGASVDIKVFA